MLALNGFVNVSSIDTMVSNSVNDSLATKMLLLPWPPRAKSFRCVNGHSGISFKFVVSPVRVFRKLNSSVTGLKQALKISDSNLRKHKMHCPNFPMVSDFLWVWVISATKTAVGWDGADHAESWTKRICTKSLDERKNCVTRLTCRNTVRQFYVL